MHANILKGRHEKGEIAKIIPFKDFVDADFFLHLYGSGDTDGNKYHGNWYPQSVLWLQNTPIFISEAEDYPKAMKLCHALGISDIDELKRRLAGASNALRFVRFCPITNHEINGIGSKGGGKIISLDE